MHITDREIAHKVTAELLHVIKKCTLNEVANALLHSQQTFVCVSSSLSLQL